MLDLAEPITAGRSTAPARGEKGKPCACVRVCKAAAIRAACAGPNTGADVPYASAALTCHMCLPHPASSGPAAAPGDRGGEAPTGLSRSAHGCWRRLVPAQAPGARNGTVSARARPSELGRLSACGRRGMPSSLWSFACQSVLKQQRCLSTARVTEDGLRRGRLSASIRSRLGDLAADEG